MEVSELSLPACYAASTHFKTVYGSTHFAADQLEKLATSEGRLRQTVSRDETRALVVLLQESLCAAREMDNLLAGNQPPRRGE
jgi:hypothetical protein